MWGGGFVNQPFEDTSVEEKEEKKEDVGIELEQKYEEPKDHQMMMSKEEEILMLKEKLHECELRVEELVNNPIEHVYDRSRNKNMWKKRKPDELEEEIDSTRKYRAVHDEYVDE